MIIFCIAAGLSGFDLSFSQVPEEAERVRRRIQGQLRDFAHMTSAKCSERPRGPPAGLADVFRPKLAQPGLSVSLSLVH